MTIYDVGREAQRLYIVMEYVPGRTLEALLREGPVSPTRATGLLALRRPPNWHTFWPPLTE